LEFHFPGNARRELEKKSRRKVVTSGNYLSLTQAVIFGFLGPNGASPLRSHGCDSSAQNSILPELARFVCA